MVLSYMDQIQDIQTNRFGGFVNGKFASDDLVIKSEHKIAKKKLIFKTMKSFKINRRPSFLPLRRSDQRKTKNAKSKRRNPKLRRERNAG